MKAIGFSDGNWLTNGYGAGDNRLAWARLPSGATNGFKYDFAGRLTNRVSSLGETASFQYNSNDAVTIMTDNTGSTTNLYDAAGRLYGINYPNGATVRYDLDALGRITWIRTRSGPGAEINDTIYQYDAAGNLAVVTDHYDRETHFDYDGVGRRIRRTHPNGVRTEWQYDWRDRVTNIVHRQSNGQVLASFGYVRAAGGEPTRITREDSTRVDLKYDGALRLTNEVYYSSGGTPLTTNGYGYDAAGNRLRLTQGALRLTNSVSAGYRITTLKYASNGATAEVCGFDNGGRVTSMSNSVRNLKLAYGTADQVLAATNGATWVTYTHDATGRRTGATNNGNVRRFMVAPTPGTDLESPLLVTDGSGNLQQLYVYAGDQPLVRLGNADGTQVYYLEDAMGSIIGLVDGSGASVATFTYDGFGNFRSLSGTTNTPSGTLGDFRFHGAWLESDTALYHMRAREYDPRTGRFTARDPLTGEVKVPETLNPYGYANANPQVYSDPSGEFTLVEMNVTTALQFTLQTLRSAAVNEVKSYSLGKLTDAFTRIVLEQMGREIFGFDINKLGEVLSANPLGAGSAFDFAVRQALCRTIGKIEGVGDHIHYNVRVVNSGPRLGDPVSAGRNCNGPNTRVLGQTLGASYSVPDFIFGAAPLVPPGGRAGMQRTEFVAEVKSRARTMYGEYVSPGRNRTQLDAILGYGRKHTDTHIVVFVVAKNDLKSGVPNRGRFYLMKRTIGGKALSNGVLPVVVNVF